MTETQTPEVVTDAQLAAAAANDGATVAVRRAAEGTVTGTDGQLTVTPARKPRKRPAVKTGNQQADRAARDAETDRNNSVLNGVSTPTPKPAKPRTARQQAARVRNEQIAQAHQPAPVPAPTPEPTAEKRSAKQDLARMVVQAGSCFAERFSAVGSGVGAGTG